MSIGLGISNSISGKISGFGAAPAPSYDPDAVAYFTAASITDVTEKDAVNQLVLDLKGTGSTTNNSDVWTDMLAFYPISPTSLAAAAYNLIDPTLYEIDWKNSPTHSTEGIEFDGTAQYGDTGLKPSTVMTSQDTSIGWKGVPDTGATMSSMGSIVTTSQRLQLLRTASAVTGRSYRTGTTYQVSASGTRNYSHYTMSQRGASDVELYEDGVSVDTGLGGGTLPNINIFFGAQNNAGSPTNYWDGEMTFGFAGNGLITNQVVDMYDAVVKYNRTVLGGALDSDAEAYMDDAYIYGRTEAAAINQLVKDLKGTGSTTNNTDLWTGLDAIYPMSPTSLEAARYNLKDTASHKITWANTPTHSVNGVSGNGTTQYGDTNFNPSTHASLNDMGATISINTNVTSNFVDFGVRDGTTSFVQLNSYFDAKAQGIINTDASGFTTAANVNSIGVYTAVRRSSTDTELYKNGSSIDTKVDTSISLPNGNIFILARNLIGSGAENFSTRRFDFAAIHTGLSDNEAQDLYDAITTYNTELSR